MDVLFALDSLFRDLHAAVKSVGLYPPTSPITVKFFNRIVEDLEPIFEEQESLVLEIGRAHV